LLHCLYSSRSITGHKTNIADLSQEIQLINKHKHHKQTVKKQSQRHSDLTETLTDFDLSAPNLLGFIKLQNILNKKITMANEP